MQHKYLLRFIKDEMERAKIPFGTNEEFFRLFLPDEPWEAYRSNVSNWLTPGGEDGTIRKRIFIAAVNEKLGLTSEIWGASEETQRKAVTAGVARFKTSLQEEESLFPWVEAVGLSDAQEAFLERAKEKDVEVLEEECAQHPAFFEKSAVNQPFLLALFETMYARGEYAFVYTNIFPVLLDSYDNGIKSKKADIYASLPTPMYREAFEILNSIKGESRRETIDLQTAAISNIRRERLSLQTLEKEELKALLKTLIKCYRKIYTPKQQYSYYPGINLAYMIALAEHIFPEECDLVPEEYSVKQLFEDTRSSIEEGKSSGEREEHFYAAMSEIEFQLLLNRKGMVQVLEMLLEETGPNHAQINQTYRQMGPFFLDIIDRFSAVREGKFTEFKAFLEVFDAYRKHGVKE